MKQSDFNIAFGNAKKEGINGYIINYAGYFWLNLTDKQFTKVYDWLLSEGKTETIQNNNKGILLESGIFIYINESN